MGQALKELGVPREEFVLSTKVFFGTGGCAVGLWRGRLMCPEAAALGSGAGEASRRAAAAAGAPPGG